MKKIFLSTILMFVFTVLFTPSVLAQSKTKALAKLPTFMAGDIELVDKPIVGDLMIAGKELKIVTDISGDVYVAGGQVEINGNVGGNLIVAGGKVEVLGKISKNLIMAGGEVKVSESAEIGGYVLAGGQEISLLGKFMGPVKLGAENLIVGEKAVINSNLEADVYKTEISTTSKIIGEKNIKIHEVKKSEVNKNQLKKIGYAGKFLAFLSKLLVVLVFVRLFGKKLSKVNIKESFWSSIGLGLMVIIVAPFLIMLSLITVVAIPLSIITFVIYLIVLYLSTIVTSVVFGSYIFAKNKLKENIYLQAIVGLLVISLLGLIPVVGWLTHLIVLLLGVGIIFKSLKIYFQKTV